MPRLGRMARKSMMMPRPPSQWVRLRQKRVAWGTISTLVMTDAPVVVKPDMVSKKASVKRGSVPPRMYGRLPKRENMIQTRVTVK